MKRVASALALGLLSLLAQAPAGAEDAEDWGLDLVAGGEPPPVEEPRPAADEGAPPPRPAPPCQGREPRTAELVRAAIAAAGLGAEEDRERAFRVRVAGFLPSLDAGVSMDLGDRQDYRYEVGSPRVDQLQVADGWGFKVGLSLDLAGSAYRSEELQVAREAVRRARERRELSLEVIRLQHARRRLLLAGLPAAGSEEGIQLEELTDLLDAWTARAFAARLCRPRGGR